VSGEKKLGKVQVT